MTSAEIDPNALLRQLNLTAATRPKPIGGGASSTLVWQIETADGRKHALRLFAAGDVDLARREQIAMAAAIAGGLPVPRIESTATFNERPLVLMEWVAGVPMLAALQPWNLFELLESLGSMQAALHRLPPPEALRDGAPGYWLQRAGDEHRTLVEHLMAQGVRTDTLVHQDFHPLNLLVGPAGITGIIDWASAAAGDPRADIALTMSILRVAPIPPGPLVALKRAMTRLLEVAWRRGYERQGTRYSDEVLAPFLAWAGAVMLHEMSPRIAANSTWGSAADLVRIQAWRDHWQKRARLAL